MSDSPGVVIVGAGHAAGMLSAALRQGGYEGSVTILGDEAYPPYQRPPLSKDYLQGTQPLERVYLRPLTFYGDKNITLRTETRVTSIDRDAKTVTIAGESEPLAYEHLVLATGSRARRLPIAGAGDDRLRNVFYLRTIADVDAMRSAFTPDQRLVIIGGGYIGLEVAAVARQLELSVVVLEMESRILQRVAPAAMSAFYDEVHTEQGVEIHCDAQAIALEGDDAGDVRAVVTANGDIISADVVLIGIGIVPNVELAEDAGITCADGIVVDEYCRTNDPAVFALGDCCSARNLALAKDHVRLESVPNATEQARVVADAIVGKTRVYNAVPWFWSDQYELKLQMAGFAADGERSVTRGDPAARKFITFYLRDGCVVAADSVNSPKEFMAARRLIDTKTPVDAATLGDADIDLKTLLS